MGEEEAGGRSKKEKSKWNSDARHERTHMSLSVTDVGCEGHDIGRDTIYPRTSADDVRGSSPHEGQKGVALPFSHDMKGGNFKRKNGAGKGKSCRRSEVYFF